MGLWQLVTVTDSVTCHHWGVLVALVLFIRRGKEGSLPHGRSSHLSLHRPSVSLTNNVNCVIPVVMTTTTVVSEMIVSIATEELNILSVIVGKVSN